MLAGKRVTREKQNQRDCCNQPLHTFLRQFQAAEIRLCRNGSGKMEGNRLYIKFATASLFGSEFLSEPVESALTVDCWKFAKQTETICSRFRCLRSRDYQPWL